jgi:hypothetical protein
MAGGHTAGGFTRAQSRAFAMRPAERLYEAGLLTEAERAELLAWWQEQYERAWLPHFSIVKDRDASLGVRPADVGTIIGPTFRPRCSKSGISHVGSARRQFEGSQSRTKKSPRSETADGPDCATRTPQRQKLPWLARILNVRRVLCCNPRSAPSGEARVSRLRSRTSKHIT